jgi:superfamily I DNA/RNA helicase
LFQEIILSTAHKAKGLEFPIVILADDFLPRSSDLSLEQLSPDEHRENLNILYVATTRATKELILNMDLFYLLYKMCRVRRKIPLLFFLNEKKNDSRNHFMIFHFPRKQNHVQVVQLNRIQLQK